MHIRKRGDHTRALFFKRTISAQIHFLTFTLALYGFLILLPYAVKLGGLHFWGTIAFGATAMLVFLISSVYHFLHDGYQVSEKLAAVMEHLDHSAIYLFIAGTYTPVLLNTIAPPWRNILMIGVWVLALLGIGYTLLKHRLPLWAQSRAVYTSLFVIMGCLFLFRVTESWSHFNTLGLFCLIAGAVSYVSGAVVYARKKPQLYEGVFGFHELWHLLSATGFAFHFAMVCSFYIYK